MKIALRRASLFAILAIGLFGFNNLAFTPKVHAAEENLICTIFPFISGLGFGINSLCTGDVEGKTAVTAGRDLITVALQLVFIGIIVISIYIIIRAAVKYIRSEGDDTKIQEAQKAIKSVFIGIAALFIGIIGIVIILAFFNAGTGTVNNLNNVIPNDLQPDAQ